MNLSRAVLGVLMPSMEGTTVPDHLAEALRGGLGGVCLFAVNTPDLETTRALCDAISELGPDTLVTTDEEGGDVTRLERVHGSSLPGNEVLGVVDDPELTRQVGRATGRLVRAAGVHLDLAPCVDVASNPLNPVIATRSFGSDPERVARHGRAFVEGLHDSGVGACLKHFPGHGDTATDSHHAVPYLDLDLETLTRRDLAPFAALSDVVDAIMPGHVVVEQLGDQPASVSAWAYERIAGLGFEGITITDALDMKAVSQQGIGEACVQALEAGADLCCLGSPASGSSQQQLADAVAAVTAAVSSGRLSVERLATSAEKVRATTHRLVAARAATDLTPDEARSGLDELGLGAARRAVQVVGDVTCTGEAVFCDLRQAANGASGTIGSVVVDQLNLGRERLGLPPVPQVTVDQASDHPGATVIALTRVPRTSPDEGAALERLLARRPDTVVVHGGMAAGAPQASRMVLAHGIGRAVARAVAEVLSGQAVDW